jgi:diguanylate cyclase (GGDEF)-like protein
MVTHPSSRLGALRRLPRDPARFYAIADLDAARRIGGVLCTFGGIIVAILLPVSPPTDEPGMAAGWLIGVGAVAAFFVAAVPLLKAPHRVSPNALLATGYGSLALIALLQWAGGGHSPYDELYVVSAIYVSAVHPPRRVLLFMAAVGVCLALPLFYDGWNGEYAGEALAHYLMWSSLSAAAMLFTADVRVQRMDLLEGEQEASALARRDPLTGLGNRRAFDEALERVVAGARRADRPLSLVIADIEGFKSVNDVHGHLEGDRCLRGVAAAIAASVRPSDDTFRWGGDEFAVLLPSTDREQAGAVVDRIAQAVSQDVPPPGDAALRLRYGVAEIGPGMDAQALMAAADADLRAAKDAEREPAQ